MEFPVKEESVYHPAKVSSVFSVNGTLEIRLVRTGLTAEPPFVSNDT